ncbi:MAG: hypothetical protein HY225_00210 [Candidatus Vogelbacteria bacterium]|nr:hypothetical protein [Candidatus Vogelbacteria bacterium]
MTSGQSATITETAAAGQKMTMSSAGVLTVTTDSSSPAYAIAAAGTTGNVLGVLKFHAANEAIDLQKLSLQLTNPGASSSPNNLIQVTLWDSSGNSVGSAIFSGANRNATSTLTSGSFIVPKDGDKTMTIKGDFQPQGVSQIGVFGALEAVDYDGGDPSGTQGKGVASGSSIHSTSASDSAVAGVRIFRTYPTVTMIQPPSSLTNGSRSLLRFKVTANSTNDVGLYKFTFVMSTSTATVTNLNAYAYSDSGFQLTAQSNLGSGGLMTNSALTWISGSGQINVYANLANSATKTVIAIPAGQSRYFEILGTVSGAVSGAIVSTQLEGDAAYVSSANLTDSVAAFDGIDTNDDFIWSPNSTGTAVAADQDWTNGYYVSGLKSNNNTAQTVSFN